MKNCTMHSILIGIVLLVLGLLAACSENNMSQEAVVPTPSGEVYNLVSPARIAPYDAETLLVSDYDGKVIYHVDKSTLELTRPIRVSGQPMGVAFAGERYFVTNKTFRSVDVLNAQGAFLYRLGSGKGAFQQVNDLAVDETLGLVYVVDTKAKVVRVFGYDGDEASYRIGEGVLINPTAIAVDSSSGNILISDFGNLSDVSAQIYLFDSNGTPIDYQATPTPTVSPMMGLGFPPPDPTPTPSVNGLTGNFSSPQGLFIDVPSGGTRTLFMVDSRAGEVQGYNLTSGNQSVVLGSLGVEGGQLFYPLDVYVDSVTSDVFVADCRNGRISVFREGGVIQ